MTVEQQQVCVLGGNGNGDGDGDDEKLRGLVMVDVVVAAMGEIAIAVTDAVS